MTAREINIKGMAKEISELVAEHLDRSTRTCINCEHFDETNELCRPVNKRPPARIIALGCEQHMDIVPF